MGACALGPVVNVDEDYHPMSVAKVDPMLRKYGWAPPAAPGEEGGGGAAVPAGAAPPAASSQTKGAGK
jgi:hypothetical protein